VTPRGLFVVGSPRSGTTLVGTYVASSPRALDLGEYRGFVLSYYFGKKLFSRTPAPLGEVYKASVNRHARQFAEDAAREAGREWFVDHTPMNVLFADRLAADLCDAVFVLMVRHPAGVLQSLARSFAGGYEWAGETALARAGVYAQFYERVDRLPRERTVAMSYDALAAEPTSTLARFERDLAALGFPTDDLDRAVFAGSHATKTHHARSTLGVVEGGATRLRPIASFDASAWSAADEAACAPRVAQAVGKLEALFPGVLCPPHPGA
jgi:hypothetical protein